MTLVPAGEAISLWPSFLDALPELINFLDVQSATRWPFLSRQRSAANNVMYGADAEVPERSGRALGDKTMCT